jgi:hypothetical protein
MLRWFPRLQVATACFSCSPPVLNFLDPYFIFMYMHYNHCNRATAHLQLNILLLLLLLFLGGLLPCCPNGRADLPVRSMTSELCSVEPWDSVDYSGTSHMPVMTGCHSVRKLRHSNTVTTKSIHTDLWRQTQSQVLSYPRACCVK